MEGEETSYRELFDRAMGIAGALRRVRGSPRIALLADNGTTYVAAYWGILLAGRTTVELNPALGDAELHSEIDNAKPGLLLAAADQRARLARLGLEPEGRALLACRAGSRGRSPLPVRELDRALGDPAPAVPGAEMRRVSPETTASIVYTSGTTGRIKGACLSHRNLVFVTGSIAESFGLRSEDPTECFAGNLPLYYTYGKSVLLLAAHLGASIAFSPRVPSARNLLEFARHDGITHLSLVPYFATLLLSSQDFNPSNLPRLRRITIAGGALHPDGLADMLARFPGRVVPMYGLTEASTRVTCMPAAETSRRPRSCGRPIPGVEVRIVGEDGRPQPTREVGEVTVRGPNVMQGYFRDPETTRQVLDEGWLRSGDLGFLDRDGYLTIAGRRKDVIKVLGESVSALGIEGVIASVEGVAEVAVKGVPDAQTGEAICAFVVPREGLRLSPEQIRRHCARELGRTRVPAHVRFVRRLPKTASGKIRKHLLRLE